MKEIYSIVKEILDRARYNSQPPFRAAEELALARIRQADQKMVVEG